MNKKFIEWLKATKQVEDVEKLGVTELAKFHSEYHKEQFDALVQKMGDKVDKDELEALRQNLLEVQKQQ